MENIDQTSYFYKELKKLNLTKEAIEYYLEAFDELTINDKTIVKTNHNYPSIEAIMSDAKKSEKTYPHYYINEDADDEVEDYDSHLEALLDEERARDAYYKHAEQIHDQMHDEGLCA